ncbi:MAG: DUF4399 domain-containing protein [Armatimonadota bacterium]|nr:DUF4399 domain-containing protein [Armatimonadota bacterium]MDR7449379.1 DUF4399 domain-containing protein [Armatimonadota bacterium]MDR7478859.1 DUF4399 domain-containing protein [Armatimonadota bacterium]MDR7490676.1 DUF4399 domain-containing protein [Armatimonadota bacterium]MDR7501502.1 DUF4399 domain-containing protein [Armatimonadota bacterium]
MRTAGRTATLLVGMLLVLAAGRPGPRTDAQPLRRPTVRLLAPAEGAILRRGPVRVVMRVTGARLVPADETHDAATGHFHLYLDKVPEHAGRPIPKGVDGIWHTAETAFVTPNLSPGLHTLILVWAHGDHVPYAPWVSDTVMFEVR